MRAISPRTTIARRRRSCPSRTAEKDADNYDNYSWTEHISRKWGQWYASPDELLEQLRLRGFKLPGMKES